MKKPPQIFFFFMHQFEGASSEVWHAEVDTFIVHFAGESEEWESTEHCEESLTFICTSSSCLADDSAHLIKYFWAAYGSGSPYC